MRTKHRKAAKAKRQWQADPAAIYRVMGRHQEFTAEEHGRVVNPVRLAFENMRTGSATDNDFHTIASACNIALIRAETISPLVESVCLVARDALLRCKGRHARTGRWGLDGPAITSMQEMLDVFDQLVALLKPHQLQEAMKEAIRRAQTGHGLHTQEVPA